jgi:phosphohistidine swiveling domain-containing protein
MVTIALGEPARARLHDAILDYFPNKLTVMDRDVLLTLVDRTLDYLRAAGLTGLAAQDVLRLTPDGMEVDVAAPMTATVSGRALYRAPMTLVKVIWNLPADPDDWVREVLPGHLTKIDELRAQVPHADAAELLELIRLGCLVRDEIFTSRRRHFLSSFAVKIMASVAARWRTSGRSSADRPRGHLAESAPSKRLQRALAELAEAWRSTEVSLPVFAAQWAGVLDAFGGRGESFIPAVSDQAWEVHDIGLRAVFDSAAASVQDLAERPVGRPARTGWVMRRLDALATERDWVIFGYEQATRVSRLALLRLGQRLSDAGAVLGPRDVFHLTLTELADSVTGRRSPDGLMQLVAARRDRYERAATLVTSELPPQAGQRPSSESVVPAVPVDAVISGFAASPGRFVGVAQVVHSLEEAVLMEPGNILVCRMTSPSWVPTMARAGAVVTDRGGVLSHAAIVARELNKPTVTGTFDATRRMRTGRPYEVDGNRGTVRALPVPPSGPPTSTIIDPARLPALPGANNEEEQ